MRLIKQRHKYFSFFITLGLVLPALIWWAGCYNNIRPPRNAVSRIVVVETTGYCNCGKCCGWKRSFFGLGRPVFSSGPNKGKPKKVGVTASGTTAQHGTIAADTSKLPFGTIIYIPRYGYGRVEDRGGAIKGAKLDLWFSSHEKALKWGRRKMKVRIWR
ncbi:MAG: 3D domain-containing protein [Kiritimatiellae bacterium]|nr:3D domain-containing protein [Kiritimatiellia bacterium]